MCQAEILGAREKKAFVDVRIFNPLAKSYQGQDLKAAHSSNEKLKKELTIKG